MVNDFAVGASRARVPGGGARVHALPPFAGRVAGTVGVTAAAGGQRSFGRNRNCNIRPISNYIKGQPFLTYMDSRL